MVEVSKPNESFFQFKARVESEGRKPLNKTPVPSPSGVSPVNESFEAIQAIAKAGIVSAQEGLNVGNDLLDQYKLNKW